MANEKVSIPVLTIDALKNFLDSDVMSSIFEELFEFVHSVSETEK